MRGQIPMLQLLWALVLDSCYYSVSTVRHPSPSAYFQPCKSDIVCHKEWKGRSDGLVAHVFFRKNANFALSVFAFAVEGWMFYSAVNSVVPQIVLNLGFEDNAWRISVRQLSYSIVSLVTSIPIT